ncbi:MAG: BrnT family toxin [Raoultibacter sp.]
MMLFEYDPKKSITNFEKHGIDFEKAQELWNDVVITVPALGDYGEERFVVLGLLEGKHWTAAITYRKDVLRIISVRRSRDKEAIYYDCKTHEH